MQNVLKLSDSSESLILLEDLEFSYQAAAINTEEEFFTNILIYGDSLLALKVLERDYFEKVNCVYIDPPYNTGKAFYHYKDSLKHSLWLTFMRERLAYLHMLIKNDGYIFVSIDDNEVVYLRVILDEIFGRSNFCGSFIWEKKKKPSFLHSSMNTVTEYILVYAKDRNLARTLTYGTTTQGKKYPINNAGNSLGVLKFPPNSVEFRCKDQSFEPQDMSSGNIVTRLLDLLEIRNGRNIDAFRLKGEWRYSQKRLDTILASNERIVISKAPFRPNHIKTGGKPKKVKNLLSRETYNIPTYEDATSESRALFGVQDAFNYPKPEGLIEFLLECSTEPGDLVLDSFVGSGTTSAVAHKMRRRWIGIELGEHAISHVVPRLKKVIDGEDPGGITTKTGWKGGGGFRFLRFV